MRWKQLHLMRVTWKIWDFQFRRSKLQTCIVFVAWNKKKKLCRSEGLAFIHCICILTLLRTGRSKYDNSQKWYSYICNSMVFCIIENISHSLRLFDTRADVWQTKWSTCPSCREHFSCKLNKYQILKYAFPPTIFDVKFYQICTVLMFSWKCVGWIFVWNVDVSFKQQNSDWGRVCSCSCSWRAIMIISITITTQFFFEQSVFQTIQLWNFVTTPVKFETFSFFFLANRKANDQHMAQ